jgi:hypothetical protein
LATECEKSLRLSLPLLLRLDAEGEAAWGRWMPRLDAHTAS